MCVRVFLNPCLSCEEGKSENLHNKLKKEGCLRKEKGVLKREPVFDKRPQVENVCYVDRYIRHLYVCMYVCMDR